MKSITAVFILFFSAAPARAGADALSFLKQDAGARGAALSGAYCAAGDDALSVFYNPAGTALINRKEILLGHNEWLEGIRNETLAYAQPLGSRLTAFAGVNALFSGSMDRYVLNNDGSKTRTGTFSSLEGAVSAGLAAGLGRGYYGGVALKSLSQRGPDGKTSDWASDAGLLKVQGGWRVGISAANFGGRLKLGSDGFSAPLMLRAGVSLNFLENYMVSAESIKAGHTNAAAALGAEVRTPAGPQEYLFLRAGYKTGRSRYAGPGFTAGVGFTSGDLRVDYAFIPYGDLGVAHRLTGALSFGVPRSGNSDRRRKGGLSGSGPESEGSVERQRKTPQKAGKKKKEKKVEGEGYLIW